MRKTLICVGNLDEHISHDARTLYMDGTKILTPAAKDALAARGVAVEYGSAPAPNLTGGLCAGYASSPLEPAQAVCLAAVLKEKFGWGCCGNAACRLQKPSTGSAR